MKCPKCKAENPDDEIFCQECDWRLDQKYVPEKKSKTRDPMVFSTMAIVTGVLALACWLLSFPWGAIICGAVGLFLGGYSITLCRLVECNKNLCMAMSAVGLLTGIIGFMMGITGL